MIVLEIIKNRSDWEKAVSITGAFFTQSFEYGLWQEGIGRKVFRFVVKLDDKVIGTMQLVKYPLLFGFSYMYCPYGPSFTNWNILILKEIKNELLQVLKKEKIIFLRIESNQDNLEPVFSLAKKSTTKGSYFQPRFEWVLDIKNKSIEDVLKGMDQTGRRMVKMADKNKVSVDTVFSDAEKYKDILLPLLNQTASRHKISLHETEYYNSVFGALNEKNSYLVTATYQNEIVSAHLIFISQKTAIYLYGGSAKTEKDVGANYACQIKAIFEAIDRKLDIYNFGGVAGPDGKPEVFSGITAFKKRFGGKYLYHGNFFDFVVNKFVYMLYCLRKIIKK